MIYKYSPSADRRENRKGRDALPFCHLSLKAVKPRSSKYPKQLNTLGDHLRARRLQFGWFQSDLAKHLGVGEGTIWRWERNECNPAVRHIPAIIRFLGYSPLPEAELLPDKLIRIRELLGLSQEAMASRLQVDETTLRRWERRGGSSQADVPWPLSGDLLII
jgi:transcriptional regulator with XRE-family HTH domain